MSAMSFKRVKITGSASAAAVLCFFMPWVLVSCNDQPVASFSGWQLAAGGVVNTALGPQPLSGSPSLFLILLAALASLGLAFVISRGMLDIRRAAFGWIGLGGLSLLLLIIKFAGAGSQASQQAGVAVGVSMRFGYWGSFLANLAIIGGAIRELRGVRRGVAALASSPAVSEPHGPEAALAMANQITCASCGAANIDGSRFCMTCGGTLEQVAV